MSWYFLHGLKMIITAVGIMPLIEKGRKKEPEEKLLVLITGDFCRLLFHIKPSQNFVA